MDTKTICIIIIGVIVLVYLTYFIYDKTRDMRFYRWRAKKLGYTYKEYKKRILGK